METMAALSTATFQNYTKLTLWVCAMTVMKCLPLSGPFILTFPLLFKLGSLGYSCLRRMRLAFHPRRVMSCVLCPDRVNLVLLAWQVLLVPVDPPVLWALLESMALLVKRVVM